MREHIILFGAGKYANKIISQVEKFFFIDAVCDNNTSIQGNLFENKYSVISVNDVKKEHANKKVLIALDSKETCDSVYEQLTLSKIYAEHVNQALLEANEKCGKEFYIDGDNIDLIESLNSSKRKIYVLTAPSHSNMGDQAQSFCIEKILRNRYPSDDIYIFDENSLVKNYYELLYIIKQHLQDQDLILLHSGYRLTNLYMVSEYIVEMMAELFGNRNMIFLPQTVNYTDKKVEERISKKINQNVTIMCRDIQSYENAQRIFQESRVVLYPDVVTSLIGRYKFTNQRKGILLVMRNTKDGESIVTDSEILELKRKLQMIADTKQTDTTIDVDWKVIARDREHYVEREIEKYSNYQLVVTNRYHGTIFALASNTPVIVLPTKDHKIIEGLKWFEEARYKDWFLCNNLSMICDMAKSIIEKAEVSNNQDYFFQRFYKEISLEYYCK